MSPVALETTSCKGFSYCNEEEGGGSISLRALGQTPENSFSVKNSSENYEMPGNGCNTDTSSIYQMAMGQLQRFLALGMKFTICVC